MSTEAITITITEFGGMISVTAPYDKAFVREARKVGGRWNRDAKAWRFDSRNRASVEAALGRCYGWAPGGGPTSDFRITLTWRNAAEREVKIMGRSIARRWRRDADVTLGEGAAVVSGDFTGRGGSVSHPVVIDQGDDVTLIVHDLPTAVMANEQLVADYEISPVPPAEADLTALRAEREKLLARVAEIDALLAAAEAIGD